MDNRPRQILKQLLAQYGPALCDHPSRCRGLLLDTLRGACEAEINALFLTLQYGMVQELRMAVGPASGDAVGAARPEAAHQSAA